MLCQRTENHARKLHVFASVCSQVMTGRGGVGGHVNVPCTSSATCCHAARMSGSVASLYAWRGGVGWAGWAGWGGMLTFLVLLPLHVATLTLFEWVTHKRGEFEKTFYRGMEKISCQTGTIDAAWSAVKDFIPNSLCSKGKDLLLYVKCWQWRCVNLHTHLQQKPISTLKHLLWKERKNLSTRPNDMNPKPTRNANLAKFSRENLAQFGLQKCLFRYGKKTIC